MTDEELVVADPTTLTGLQRVQRDALLASGEWFVPQTVVQFSGSGPWHEDDVIGKLIRDGHEVTPLSDDNDPSVVIWDDPVRKP